LEAPPEAGNGGYRLRHHREHRRRRTSRHPRLRTLDRSGHKARPYFSKEEFAYDPQRDLYTCPAGQLLRPRASNKARRLSVYKAKIGTCERCELRPKCTDNKTGRQVLRYFDERYVDRVRSYRGTFPYEKALRKKRVWVEPLFAEAKDLHGL
jgi:hypothetical protein